MMKLLIGVFLISIVVISCNKDEGKKETKNFLKIGDTEYDLSGGIVENNGYGSHKGYRTDVTLYSKGLSLEVDGNEWELLGKGHGIYFEMYSTVGNVLDNKEYTFCSANDCPIGTFRDGEYMINYDSETNDYERAGEIEDGKISISVNGSEYSITFNCAGYNGEKITGFYKGTLRYFDWLHGKKSAGLKSTLLKEQNKIFKH